MSYTPHTWTSGEVVTAAKMNALEQGAASGGGGLLIDLTDMDSSPYTTDVLGSQVIAALESGAMPLFKFVDGGDPFYALGSGGVRIGEGGGGAFACDAVGPCYFASPSSYVIVEYWDD